MSEPVRKKSASSDSELSDGWSLVEHPDTAPLTARGADITPQLHSPVTLLQTAPPTPPPQPGSPSEETSSDAESVEIIHEDARLGDFTYPLGISRITTLTKVGGDGEKEGSDLVGRSGQEVKEVLYNEVSSSPDYFVSPNFYSNEWFRLLIFISSLVALVLLLVSYTSLFFKEQAYSKSDGLIVLPDEDLSSLITDLALLKEENKRLKQELNLANYDYRNEKKTDAKHTDQVDIASTDDIIGLEVISNESPIKLEPITFKPVTNSLDRGKATEKLASNHFRADDITQQKRVEDLVQLEDNLKRFAGSIGLNNVVVSSYNIAHNLESINSIVDNLKSIIDKETSSKKESKKFQLEQKLVKLHSKIEQDFKKSVEKVAKRVSKFHDEFLSAFCRIKGDLSVADNIDCSKFNQAPKQHYHKSQNHKDGYKKQQKNYDQSVHYGDDKRFFSGAEKPKSLPNSEDSPRTEKINQENDSKMRYKRDGDYDKDFKSHSDSNHHKSGKHEHSNDDKKHKKSDKYYKEKKEHSDTTVDNDSSEEITDIDQTKHFHDSNVKAKEEQKREKPHKEHKNKEHYKEMKEDWKKDKGHKYHQHYDDKQKHDNKFVQNDNLKTKFDDVTSPEENREKKNSDDLKCTKKNCGKQSEPKVTKNNQRFHKVEQDFVKFGNTGKNPSGLRPIHNESIYSKIINGKHKSEPNGEWYLDLGEVRNQKRMRRAMRDRSGWLFDRALVREWCRTNSGSSLCASFGQICDYCA